VKEKIEYRFRVSSTTVFTLYLYSKFLEYRIEYVTRAVVAMHACPRSQWRDVRTVPAGHTRYSRIVYHSTAAAACLATTSEAITTVLVLR
jgi:hypothetical protein